MRWDTCKIAVISCARSLRSAASLTTPYHHIFNRHPPTIISRRFSSIHRRKASAAYAAGSLIFCHRATSILTCLTHSCISHASKWASHTYAFESCSASLGTTRLAVHGCLQTLMSLASCLLGNLLASKCCRRLGGLQSCSAGASKQALLQTGNDTLLDGFWAKAMPSRFVVCTNCLC